MATVTPKRPRIFEFQLNSNRKKRSGLGPRKFHPGGRLAVSYASLVTTARWLVNCELVVSPCSASSSRTLSHSGDLASCSKGSKELNPCKRELPPRLAEWMRPFGYMTAVVLLDEHPRIISRAKRKMKEQILQIWHLLREYQLYGNTAV